MVKRFSPESLTSFMRRLPLGAGPACEPSGVRAMPSALLGIGLCVYRFAWQVKHSFCTPCLLERFCAKHSSFFTVLHPAAPEFAADYQFSAFVCSGHVNDSCSNSLYLSPK